MILLLQIRKTIDFLIIVLRQVFAIFLKVIFTFCFDFYYKHSGFCYVIKECYSVFSHQNP